MKKSLNSKDIPKKRPGLTPESRENQVISEAMDLAEQQILSGTASSQVLTHFLRLGSLEKQLEMEKLRNENELLKAKTNAIASAKKSEELYLNALRAMKRYSGGGDQDFEDGTENIDI